MRIIVTSDHTSSFPNPITFSPGDPLRLGKRDSEYPGWIWVTTPCGGQGWAPDAYIEAASATQGVATESYTAKELNTVAGESLIRHKELNEWLWVENDYGECGWIPKKTTSDA